MRLCRMPFTSFTVSFVGPPAELPGLGAPPRPEPAIAAALSPQGNSDPRPAACTTFRREGCVISARGSSLASPRDRPARRLDTTRGTREAEMHDIVLAGRGERARPEAHPTERGVE
jgi:hypothetical protein